MPYSGKDDSKLPKYVKSRPDATRSKWVAIFNAAFKKYGEEKALVLANTWLKKQVKAKKFIKRSSISFEVVAGKKFLRRDRDGNEYVTLVMANTLPHKDGKRFSESTLKKWANEINANPTVGDVDHTLYDRLLNSGMDDDNIINVLKSKKGIAKTVRAVYEKGKLWVRAIVDKRYRTILNKSRGVSVEAVADLNGTSQDDWKFLGFTFNVKSNPAVYGAGVV